MYEVLLTIVEVIAVEIVLDPRGCSRTSMMIFKKITCNVSQSQQYYIEFTIEQRV